MKMMILAAVLPFLLAGPPKSALPPSVVMLGVDFTHAVFYDEHILKEKAVNTRSGLTEPVADLIEAKIPTWNRETVIFFGQEVGSDPLAGMTVEADPKISEARNAEVLPDAVKWIAPKAKDAPALSDERLKEETEPYLAPGENKAGLLLVVDQINKEEGVVAHYVLFRRDTGAVIKSERFSNKASGVGLRNYYLNGLKRFVKDVRHSVKKLN